WFEVYAGEKWRNKFGEWLIDDTVEALRESRVAIEGPLTTSLGGAIRSLKVTLRQVLDLYAGVRHVRWCPGVPGPVKEPHKSDMIGVGIKPVSEFGSKRLVRAAIQYAIDNKRKSVTLVHKGNIQKFTEGAFRDWGYQVALEEFRPYVITEEELWSDEYKGK